MEVTHIAHQNTHAIIGGQKPESFEVEDNAEFYEMLSSTLYPNKKLAVVREVLCNSWDAHLMVGKTDVPVEVTINEKEMSFKDFGPGIGRDQIIKIYCTYGKSTKSHDGKQTGGFGLGSKSPFAYSKHFTVVSCHNGKRAIYAASRGSSETNGKPDFRAMASDIPTDETGITVTIPLLNASERNSFEILVRDLAYLGGIKVKLNDKVLPVFDYAKANLPFVLMDSSNIGNHHRRQNGIYLRYGAVVYPVDFNDETIVPIYNKTRLLRELSSSYAVVLLADPNTIGVAPSRETLSYTDKTCKTIVDLLERSEKALRANRHVAAEFVLKHICYSSAKAEGGPFKALKHTMIQRLSSYARACDVLYRNRLSVPTKGITAKEIANCLAAVTLYRRDARTLRSVLDDMPDEVLFEKMRVAIYKAHPGIQKYLRQIEVPRYSKDRYDNGTKYEYQDKSSLKRDILSGLTRLDNKIKGFGFETAYGRLSRDGFVVDTQYEDDNLRGFAHAMLIAKAEKKFARPKNITASFSAVFAPSRLAAKRWRDETKLLTESNRVVILLTRRNSDVEGAKAFLEKIGIATYDARNHQLKRAKLEVSSEFYLLQKPGALFGTVEKYDHEQAPAAFYCYGQIDERKDGTKFPRGNISSSIHQYIADHVGPVVIAMNAADARALSKLGLCNVYEKVADDVRTLMNNPACVRELFLKANIMPEATSWIENIIRPDAVEMKTILRAFEEMGAKISTDGVLSGVESQLLSIVTNLAHSKDSRGKFGINFVLTAIKEIETTLKERFQSVTIILESEEFAGFLSGLDSYYARKMNRVIRLNVILAALQTVALQVALKPKTN